MFHPPRVTTPTADPLRNLGCNAAHPYLPYTHCHHTRFFIPIIHLLMSSAACNIFQLLTSSDYFILVFFVPSISPHSCPIQTLNLRTVLLFFPGKGSHLPNAFRHFPPFPCLFTLPFLLFELEFIALCHTSKCPKRAKFEPESLTQETKLGQPARTLHPQDHNTTAAHNLTKCRRKKKGADEAEGPAGTPPLRAFRRHAPRSSVARLLPPPHLACRIMHDKKTGLLPTLSQLVLVLTPKRTLPTTQKRQPSQPRRRHCYSCSSEIHTATSHASGKPTHQTASRPRKGAKQTTNASKHSTTPA